MKTPRIRRERKPRFPVSGDVAVLIALALAVLVAAWGGRTAPAPRSEPPAKKALLPSAPSPPPVDAVEPQEPELRPATGCPEGCETPPTGCFVKGNISWRTGERIYHVPGGEYYDKAKISPEKDERWFCTEEEAEQNGWRRSKR